MAWSLVQQSAAQTANSVNTLPANSTGGNLLVAVVGCASSTAVTAPGGWVTGPSITNGAVNETYIFYYPNNPGGLSSFTFSGGSGTNSVVVGEFTCPGVVNVGAANATGTATAGAVASVAVSSGATAQPGDLVITGGFEHLSSASAITWTDPGGFNEFAGLRVSSLQNHCYAAYELGAAAGGAQSVTITSSVASTLATGWTGVVATFTQPNPGTVLALARARVPQNAPRGRTASNRGPVAALRLTNSFDGGTSGNSLTSGSGGNTGGASGNFFGNIFIGTSATLAFDNAHAAHGTVSCKVATGSTATTDLAEWTAPQGGLQPTLWFRQYLYVTANPAAAYKCFSLRSGASPAVSVGIGTTGVVVAYDGAGNSPGTTVTKIPLNAWFRVEGTATASNNGNGTFSVSLYTSPDAQIPAETITYTGVNTTGAFTQAWFGITSSTANVTAFWMDDVGVSNTGPLGPVSLTGAPSSGQPARVRIPALTPVSKGRVAGNAGAPVNNPTSGPVFRQATQPIRGLVPQTWSKGRASGNPGAPVANPTASPVFRLPRQAVRACIPQVFSKGRASGNPGTPVSNPTPGPAFYPFRRPSRAPVLPPPRGRASWRAGNLALTPAPVYPLHGPVRAPVPQPFSKGRSAGNQGAPARNPTAGPPVKAPPGPARAPVPAPFSKGRTSGNAGASVHNPTTGPAFFPLHWPARIRLTLPPRGRSAGNKGAPVSNPVLNAGPPFFPFRQPARTRLTLPFRGRVAGNRGAPVANPTAGPAVKPLAGPVRAPVPQTWSKGRASGNPGAPVANSTAGPVFRQAVQPARAHIPQVFSKGRAAGNAGAPLRNPTTGPVFRQATGPARARPPQTWSKGHATGNIGAPVQNPAAVQLAPPRKAVHAQPAVFSKGRIAASPGAPVRNLQQGPPFYPLNHPVAAKALPRRPGSARWRYGTFTPPPVPLFTPGNLSIAPAGPLAAVATLLPTQPAVVTIAPAGPLAAALTASTPGQRPVTWEPPPPLALAPSPGATLLPATADFSGVPGIGAPGRFVPALAPQ